MRKAVIDVGSNSVLLTVEESVSGGKWEPVFESSRVTALGAGTKETGLLSEESMQATLMAIKEAYTKSEDLGVQETIAAATMAARIARNTHEFLHRALLQNTPVFVLPGEDEAQLGLRAVADDDAFSTFKRLAIIDPGGHSTELVTADREDGAWNTSFRHSFAIGTLGLRGTILRDESPEAPAILSAVELIDDTVREIFKGSHAGEVVVLGATGTNLITIREGMTEWDPVRVHGSYLEFGEISEAVGRMMSMSDAERGRIVGMEPGREKTLHIGALVLERFLQALGARGCYVSVRGWRHALLEQGLPYHPARA